MSHYHSYLNSAVTIIGSYDGRDPLASFLKKYFAANKKFGSKDRKAVSHLCYCYYRLGKTAFSSIEERVVAALFLCSTESSELLEALKPGWNTAVKDTLEKKFSFINSSLLITDVFPWKDELSDGVDHASFCKSFFIQPDVFIRLRPGHEALVQDKLNKAAVDHKIIGDRTIALPAGTKIEHILALDYDAMVQDMNSQRVGELMQLAVNKIASPFISAWDCCAASGGKSIMLFDIHEKTDLVVSDIRESILRNLKQRFKEHGIKKYETVLADLSKQTPTFKSGTSFDFIFADVPCSGSGTWGRTPEELFYFEQTEIENYAALQRKIIANTVRSLNSGGYYLYITCSVFKKENEEAVAYIQENFHLELLQMEILKGYDKKADTMFAALFKKPL